MENYMQIHHTDTDITITETEYVFHMKRPRDFSFSKGGQEYHVLAMILSGSARYRVDGKTFTVQKGDVVFLQTDTCYSAKVISGELWEQIVVAFRTYGDTSALPPNGAIQVSHGSRFEELFRQAYSVWSQCAFGYKIQTKGIIHNILFSLMQESASRMLGSDTALQALKAAADHVEQNYRQKITVEELAERSGSQAVGALVDFFHFYMNGESDDVLLCAKGRLYHAHIARPAPDRRVPTADDMPTLRKWAQMLSDIGYDGGLSLECAYSEDYEGDLRAAAAVLSVFRER